MRRLIAPIANTVMAWNTQRLYQEHGQKIAVQAWQCRNSDESRPYTYGVVMLDISRGVFYFMPCEDSEHAVYLAQSRHFVMKRYDNNEMCQNCGRYMCESDEALKAYDKLLAAAEAAPDREGMK